MAGAAADRAAVERDHGAAADRSPPPLLSACCRRCSGCESSGANGYRREASGDARRRAAARRSTPPRGGWRGLLADLDGIALLLDAAGQAARGFPVREGGRGVQSRAPLRGDCSPRERAPAWCSARPPGADAAPRRCCDPRGALAPGRWRSRRGAGGSVGPVDSMAGGGRRMGAAMDIGGRSGPVPRRRCWPLPAGSSWAGTSAAARRPAARRTDRGASRRAAGSGPSAVGRAASGREAPARSPRAPPDAFPRR